MVGEVERIVVPSEVVCPCGDKIECVVSHSLEVCGWADWIDGVFQVAVGTAMWCSEDWKELLDRVGHDVTDGLIASTRFKYVLNIYTLFIFYLSLNRHIHHTSLNPLYLSPGTIR